MGIGLTEGLLIAAIALLLFGGKKIPQLGKTLGASIKGFKEGMKHDPNATEETKVEIIIEDKKNKKS
jgi:sec-independent protein translocase protein TatA